LTAAACLLIFAIPLRIQGLVDGAVGAGGFSIALGLGFSRWQRSGVLSRPSSRSVSHSTG
jgi:hypothetical protein